jgi:hypothetical protein
MVHLPARSPALFFGAILFLSTALAAMALWVFVHAEAPFDYMVAGTFTATAVLALVFFFLVGRRLL